MYKLINKSRVGTLFLLVFLQHAGYAHDVSPDNDPASTSGTETLRKVIKKKIDYYNSTYPDILFVQVDGGVKQHGDLKAIKGMLGTGADALDYQHPADLREMLMDATMERLRIMLERDAVSATLFKVGESSTIDRTNLCIITLNPVEYVANDYYATRYMLDLSDAEMKKVHPARYLDHIHHLQYTVDHEAFHCLDSVFNGGVPQTYEKWGGEYNMFRRESIADAYAMVMHIREHGDVTRYAQNMAHIRALWLYADSPNRCTFETVREVLRYDDKVIRSVTVKDLIGLVTHIRDRSVGDYQTFVAQHAATVEAARQMDIDISFYGQQWQEMQSIKTNPALVKYLLNRYKFYYAKLFTDEPIPLEAPHEHEWKK